MTSVLEPDCGGFLEMTNSFVDDVEFLNSKFDETMAIIEVHFRDIINDLATLQNNHQLA